MMAALGDDAHVAEQRERYARPPQPLLRSALRPRPACGSSTRQAGLYLWATRDEDCWASVEWLASSAGSSWRPVSSTAPPARGHVRVALTATDERVAEAVARLGSG